jgi:mRNA interferase MazF
MIVAPVTSRVRPFLTSVVLPEGSPVTGEILLHQIRSIDILARPLKFAGRVSEEVAGQVRERLGMLVGI